MTTGLLPDELVDSTKEVSNLRVSVIYEDAASAVRAKGCLHRIAQNLDLDNDSFTLRLWSFDQLSDPTLRTATAKGAGNFDIIFFSTRRCGEPTATVKTWMQEWLQCRNGQPCALAVLLDPALPGKASDEAPLREYFTDVARRGGLDLLCPYVESSEPLATQTIRQLARSAINASPILDDILEQWESHSHWGINE